MTITWSATTVLPRSRPSAHAQASAASDAGDLGPFERLLDALRQPYDDVRERAGYAEPAPAHVTEGYRTFCGT